MVVRRTLLTGSADRILDAAREVFTARGYEAASISAIARRAGVAEGTIYKHYASKRDLLEAVIRAFYEPLIDETARIAAGIADVRERLRFLVRQQLRAFAERPDLCRLVVAEGRRLDGYHRSGLAELNRRYTALAVDAVRQGQRRGDLRDDLDPGLVRDVLYGAVEHAAWKAVSGVGRLEVDATAEAIASLLLDGISARTTLEDRVARLERLVGEGS